MEKRGIDISHWNKVINFDRASGDIDFVILKAGGSDKGFYKDSTFEKYYHEFHDVRGIPTGAYYFVGRLCIDYQSGVNDALKMLDLIKGKKFEYPIYIDLESTSPKHRQGATEACKGFCDTIEKAGYYAGIYASDISGFIDRLDKSQLDRYDKWSARYGSEPKNVEWGMWQYSSKGTIDGINGNVDLDIAVKSYPEIMKRAHLNGY